MTDISLSHVLAELQTFNAKQDEVIQMDDLRDERDQKAIDSSEKRSAQIRSRIDLSNTLLEKITRGIGAIVKFEKESDMQQAEDRRELMAALHGIKDTNQRVEKSDDSSSDGEGFDIKGGFFNLFMMTKLGQGMMVAFTTVGAIIASIKAFPGKIMQFFTRFRNTVTPMMRQMDRLTAWLKNSQLGRLTRWLGRLAIWITVITSAFSGINTFLDSKKAGMSNIDAFKEGFIDFMDKLFGWVLELPFKLGAWIADKLGADVVADALREVSFKETIRGIIETGQKMFEWFFTKALEAWQATTGFVDKTIDTLKESITSIIRSVTDRINALIPDFLRRDTPEQKKAKLNKEIEELRETIAEDGTRTFFGFSRDKKLRDLEKELEELLKENPEVSRMAPKRAMTSSQIAQEERELMQNNARSTNMTNVAVGGNTQNNTSNSNTTVMSVGVPSDGIKLSGLSD